jgi:hypothetical protein
VKDGEGWGRLTVVNESKERWGRRKGVMRMVQKKSAFKGVLEVSDVEG